MQEHNELAQTDDSQTDTTRLQPMNFTDILDGIFTVYRNHYRLLLEIAAVYLVLGFAVDLISAYFIIGATPSTIFVIAGFSLMATSVISLLVTAGLMYASAQVYLTREMTSGAAFQQALRRFWSYLGSGVLYLLAVGGLCITVIGIPFGIYFGVRWSLYSLPVLLEESKAWNALGRSTELVKGSWWRVLGILIAIYLISGMITIILYISTEFILTLTGIIATEQAEGVTGLLDTLRRLFAPTPTEAGWVTYAVQRFVGLLIATLTMPIALIGTTLLYFDLRIRKEAFDIEVQVTE
ncbi:MAG: hypothetical protein OXN27_17875 [Candidatus Poribacteria bacterium]|nr:hypothetical protein [Candidatus Poribacteria bacterium]MDE0325788.1 hypothetical protein [Candidatus Poribacteria bacterium]